MSKRRAGSAKARSLAFMLVLLTAGCSGEVDDADVEVEVSPGEPALRVHADNTKSAHRAAIERFRTTDT